MGRLRTVEVVVKKVLDATFQLMCFGIIKVYSRLLFIFLARCLSHFDSANYLNKFYLFTTTIDVIK